MVDFIVFLVLFLGGMWLLGAAWEMPAWQGVAFSAGIIMVSLAMAYVMRQRGSATRRSDSWGHRQK
ncbi:hypothetical protein [Microbacterium sp.]|uniref:hypothetical protein n=1 Tax=Microbacterium sp. TaxID=51671 RepID=UPI0028AA31B1|nr:hypothetical protein [Microbacterium sp.]